MSNKPGEYELLVEDVKFRQSSKKGTNCIVLICSPKSWFDTDSMEWLPLDLEFPVYVNLWVTDKNKEDISEFLKKSGWVGETVNTLADDLKGESVKAVNKPSTHKSSGKVYDSFSPSGMFGPDTKSIEKGLDSLFFGSVFSDPEFEEYEIPEDSNPAGDVPF